MQTMIDSTMPELSDTPANQVETQHNAEPRNQPTGWLILAVTAILAYVVFRLVMLQLDVHIMLDDLMAVTGQPPLSKT